MSPNSLNPVEGSDSSGFSEAPPERRRFPRLAISREAFRLKAIGKLYPLADLSLTGFCLRVKETAELQIFPVGAVFQGELGFRGERIHVHAQVRHLERGFVGAEFQGLSPAAQELLKQKLDPQVLGAELRLIPGHDLEQLWFHAMNGADWNLAVDSSGQVRHFLLRLHGAFTRWDSGTDRVVTGKIGHALPEDLQLGAVRMESWTLHPEAQPDPAKLRIAIALLSGCKEKQDYRDFCVEKITGARAHES